MSDSEAHQVLRDLYPSPEDERFYATALAVLSRPRRVLRTVALVVNTTFYALWLCAGAFLVEQGWDRAQAPFDIRSAVARPGAVVAGEPVHVALDILRHRRCTYAVTWSVTDSALRIVSHGPVERRAPGGPGPDAYTPEYVTPADMAPGPAILRIALRGECDGNWLDNWWPRTIDMPPVPFEVVKPTKP